MFYAIKRENQYKIWGLEKEKLLAEYLQQRILLMAERLEFGEVYLDQCEDFHRKYKWVIILRCFTERSEAVSS